MNLISTSILALLLGVFIFQDVQSAEISIPSPPPLKIDKNLRKALLKALEKLDEEDTSVSESREFRESTENEESSTEDNENKSDLDLKLPIHVKEEDEEEINADIYIHSASPTEESKKEANNNNNEIIVSKSLEKNILKPNPQKRPTVPVLSPGTNKHFLTLNQIESLSITPKPAPVTQKTASSPNPTHSTPLEEEDGIENVKVEDVQFIHAPLVAAFTVQQDDKGLPQKVIPLFGNKNALNKPKQTFDPVRTLEEKQRTLEQEILFLQQKRKQEELLLRHQVSVGEEYKKQLAQKGVQNKLNSLENQRAQLPVLQNSAPFSAKTTQNNLLNQELPLTQSSIHFSPAQELSSPLTIKPEPLIQPSIQLNPIGSLVQKPLENQKLPLTHSTIQFAPAQEILAPHQKPIETLQQLPLVQNTVQFAPAQQLLAPFPKPVDTPKLQQLPLVHSNVQFTPATLQKFESQKLQAQQLPSIQPSLKFNPQNIRLVNNPQLSFNPIIQQSFKEEVKVPKSQITIQPSLSFQPSRFTSGIVPIQYNELQFAAQQPPIKEAINFQSHNIPFFTQTRNNIITQQAHPNPFIQNKFNENFIQDLSLRSQFPPTQNIRVFRQESQTGNFGLNDFNRFQNFGNVQTIKSNGLALRPLETRPLFTPGHNQLNIDTRLKNLFYQTGFGQGRSQEDFNIVSKVLALDHQR